MFLLAACAAGSEDPPVSQTGGRGAGGEIRQEEDPSGAGGSAGGHSTRDEMGGHAGSQVGGAAGSPMVGQGGAGAFGGQAGRVANAGGSAGESANGQGGMPAAPTPHPSYVKVKSIFDRSCALSGCHVVPSAECANLLPGFVAQKKQSGVQGCAQNGVSVGSAEMIACMVNKPKSTGDCPGSTGQSWMRQHNIKTQDIFEIVPGRAEVSYIYMKTIGKSCHGHPMPERVRLSQNPEIGLSDADRDAIKDWINGGAPIPLAEPIEWEDCKRGVQDLIQ